MPIINVKGHVTLLRAHDPGTGYGAAPDFLDADAVFQLDTEPGRTFGFTLRNDTDRVAHQAMFDLLRHAFEHDHPVQADIELATGMTNGRAQRIWVTAQPRRGRTPPTPRS